MTDDARKLCQACEDAARLCDKIWEQDYGTAGAGSSAACALSIRSSCRHAQPAASAVRVPEGWKLERGNKPPFKTIIVKSPDNYVAVVSDTDRNPAIVLYKLADAMLAQPAASAAPGAGVSELTRDRIEELRDEILFAIDRMPSAMMSEMSALCDLALQSLRSDAKAPGAMPEEPRSWFAYDHKLECDVLVVTKVSYDALQSKLSAAYAAVRDADYLNARLMFDSTLAEWRKKHAATIAAAGGGK